MNIFPTGSFARFDIPLDVVPAGYSMTACKPGDHLWIAEKEFVSSEDGELLIGRLEGWPASLLQRVTEKYNVVFQESEIQNMLMTIRRDKTASVHINAPMKALIQPKAPKKAGQIIFREDIADVREVVFRDVDIPDDAGLIAYFSVGWRRGLFYDFSILAEKDGKREYNFNQLMGCYYSYLSFQSVFKISDAEWANLLNSGWFPFVTLDSGLIDSMLNYNRQGWNVDDLLGQIQADVLKRLPDRLKVWANIKAFESQMEFITTSVERYRSNDYISCISVLFPRIEGILREFQRISGQHGKTRQVDLAATVISPALKAQNHQFTPLLPLKFSKYLEDVYFADFDPKKKDNTLSRNTVGHGVATKENFDLKGSTIGFLILDQLSYYFTGVQGNKGIGGRDGSR